MKSLSTTPLRLSPSNSRFSTLFIQQINLVLCCLHCSHPFLDSCHSVSPHFNFNQSETSGTNIQIIMSDTLQLTCFVGSMAALLLTRVLFCPQSWVSLWLKDTLSTSALVKNTTCLLSRSYPLRICCFPLASQAISWLSLLLRKNPTHTEQFYQNFKGQPWLSFSHICI